MNNRKLMTTIAFAAALALGGGAVLAHGAGDARAGQDAIGQKTMSQGKMGRGMMGQGMMNQGMMGRGMMGQGIMNPCMMGASMHGPAMMGLGMHGPAMMGYGAGRDLSAGDVRKMLERHLAWLGNDRLKLGEVQEKDDGNIVADIVTVDDSLVRRLEFNRRGGFMRWMH